MHNLMKIILQMVLITFSSFLYPQSITIKGKVVYSSDMDPLSFSAVYLGSANTISAITDFSGDFLLVVDKSRLKDSIKISALGCREMFILNLPKNLDIIDLGSVPVFDGNPGVPIADFFCKGDDFECKKSAELFWENVAKENEAFGIKINQKIDDYRCIYNNQPYRIRYSDDLYYPTTTIDLQQP